VSVPAWLGSGTAPLDRNEALARLARRYLASHGPATAQDLGKWAGVPLGDARRGVEAIADEVIPFGDGLVVLAGNAEAASLPPPRLLGPFDPILHGWASRAPFVGEHAGVVTAHGVFRAVGTSQGCRHVGPERHERDDRTAFLVGGGQVTRAAAAQSRWPAGSSSAWRTAHPSGDVEERGAAGDAADAHLVVLSQ
jgi:hypothetical protein